MKIIDSHMTTYYNEDVFGGSFLKKTAIMSSVLVERSKKC